jgi:FkbM family methyltransferase
MLSDLAIALGNRLGRGGRAVRILRPAYSAWLNAAYGGRGMPWRLNGEPLRIHPAVRHLIPQDNERPLFEHLRAGIRPGDLIFDIGAFLGTYAVFEARWTGTQGRVVAFEPSPFSFAMFSRHLAMNGLGPDRVDARHAAIGASVGRQRLVAFEDEPYRNYLSGDGTSGQVSVDVLTVDAVCAELGRAPDWIRMDVQGLEFDVLSGARETIRSAGRSIRVIVETHPEQWSDLGIDAAEAHDRFAVLGLRARPLAPADPLFTQGGHVILEPMP